MARYCTAFARFRANCYIPGKSLCLYWQVLSKMAALILWKISTSILQTQILLVRYLICVVNILFIVIHLCKYYMLSVISSKQNAMVYTKPKCVLPVIYVDTLLLRPVIALVFITLISNVIYNWYLHCLSQTRYIYIVFQLNPGSLLLNPVWVSQFWKAKCSWANSLFVRHLCH